MADISQITLPNGDVVTLKDSAGREAATTGLAGKVSIAQGVQNQGKILQVSSGGTLELVDPESGSGDVTGPSSASNNNVVVFDGTTGKLIKDSGFTIGKSVPSDAVFTDTTYESKSAASGGTDESLVTTGEKYIWNSKTSNVGTVTGVKMNSGSSIEPDANGVVDLGTVITSHQDITGKADLVDGKVPSTQLPSYVDDVLEYASLESFPLTGEAGKIYIATDTNKTYRWSGSAYVEISESLALGETSSSAYRGDRGAAAYAASVTNVDSTPTENSTHLITSGGVWEAENEKIDKKYELDFGSVWSVKEWTGLTNFYGLYIWLDGENIYYSNGSSQYVLNKSTSTWSVKEWFGLTSFYGYQVWTDGENIYFSNDSYQYVLDKSTSTWSTKEWTGLTSFDGQYVWTDGENIYYNKNEFGRNDQYVLDKSTSTWSGKGWPGLSGFQGKDIWTDGENIYYSSYQSENVLDKSTSTWSTKTWYGLTEDIYGVRIWTDGDNFYYSNGSSQYVLDKSTSTWSTKEWTGLTNFDGSYIWSDGDNIYYSYNSNHYVLNRDNSRNKLLFGSNGEFTVVDANTVIPDISNKADLINGKVPSYQLPSYIDEKIDKKYKISFGSNWSVKEWTGLTNYAGLFVWSDGDNIYYSNGSDQYVLNKSTSTWSTKTWNGLSSYSSFIKMAIWTDGENIYYSPGSDHYVLNKSTSTWSSKVWYGLTGFHGSSIWSDERNIYYSNGSTQKVLDKSTSTWSEKEWTGLTNFYGNNIWTDGENTYYNNSYVLDKATSTWSAKTWTGLNSFNGTSVWTDGENIYYSYGTTQYALDKDNSSKLLLGTSGEFNPVSTDDVLPSDMIGASSSAAGTHGLVPAPSAGDQDKFLKGDGTWGEVSSSHAAFIEYDVNILATDWVAGTNVYTYTYTNSAILSDTLVDVFYKDGAEDVLQSRASVTKAAGSVTLTVKAVPTGTLSIIIRLIQNTDSTIIGHASTTEEGIVQLSDSTTDTSTSKSATANAVKMVKDSVDTVNTNLGSPSSASGVTGNDAFSKINTLNSKLTAFMNNEVTSLASAKTMFGDMPIGDTKIGRISGDAASALLGSAGTGFAIFSKTASDRWEIISISYNRGRIAVAELDNNIATFGTIKKVTLS